MNLSRGSTGLPEHFVLRRPDDWHVHLRDGAQLVDTAAATAHVFARALVMPNLRPPVFSTDAAESYCNRILAAVPAAVSFTPLMTLYLTDHTTAEEIATAKASGIVLAVKYYPAGATTNSAFGVTRIERAYPALAAMEAQGVVLSVHGEVTDPAVDIFDREQVFVETILTRIVRDFPALKIVMEHITTQEAQEFVMAAGDLVAATITPQHLLYARNALLVGGLRPHLYCLPILKRERHRQALVRAATSGSPRFFLGTDSAPHARGDKENDCGCAGCFSAPVAIALYAEVFEEARALDRFEAFASEHGADFYGLPRNEGTIRLARQPWTVPASYRFGEEEVVPLRGGETIGWRLDEHQSQAGPASAARK